jgi:hypothetical protein
MALFTTEDTLLSFWVKKALARMSLHVTFCSSVKFTCSIAERTERVIQNQNEALPITY